MRCPLDRGGSTSEHDYVMRSRSRDRTCSTREPRAFISLRATHYWIRTNGPPLFDVNVLHVSDPSEPQQVSLTIVAALQARPNTHPMTYLCHENVYSTRPNGPFDTSVMVPRSPPTGHMLWFMRVYSVLSLLSTLDVAL